MEEEIMEHETLAEALLYAQAEYPPLEKGSTVDMQTYKYKYADLAYTKSVTDPYLRKHGLVVSSRTEYRDSKELCISTMTHVQSKEMVSSEIDVTEPHGDLKLFGGNITYARRYNYWCLTGRIGEDSSEARPLQRGRQSSADGSGAPLKKQGDLEGNKGTGSAEGDKGPPSSKGKDSIGDVKNRIIKLESKKKDEGASQTMVNEVKERELGNLILNHPIEKLLAYETALTKLGSIDIDDLESDPRAEGD